MKILVIIHAGSGVSYHRLIVPFMTMENVDVYITNKLLEDDKLIESLFDNADLVVYNRTLPDYAINEIYKLRDRRGFKILVDIDDHWELDEHHILYKSYQEQNYTEKQVKFWFNLFVILFK